MNTEAPVEPAFLRLTEPELRTVLLAQSLEQMDAVSPPERDAALHQAVSAARQRGVVRVGVADIVRERARALAERAAARDPALAALAAPSARLRWLARGLPLAALLLGLAADRVANAHRVDLLSPPLLLVLAWNLAMYALLAWRALRRKPAHGDVQELPLLVRRWARSAPARRGLAARVAADFHARWFAATAAPFAQRLARVLHLCAAAWGAGIALSLLARGLVVRYQFGWESTFLDADQVHAIVSVLFWPLTALLGLAPFTLQEIVATQNFAGEGAAGSRWVWMYVGLLLLLVVLPRLLLAAWARWREARGMRDLRLDLRDRAFDALRAALPGDVVVGVLGATPAQAAALRALAAVHAVHVPEGLHDQLRFTDAVHEPVDAVIALADAPVPPPWQGAPRAVLPWAQWGESWVLEPVLFERLAALLPARRAALERLGRAWGARNEEWFEQSLQALARHLRACAAMVASGDAAPYAQHLQSLDATLRTVHGQAAVQPPDAAAAPAPRLPPAARADGTVLALGTSAGAAAGAAAGAKAGALIDVGLGGLTLGAGTALGALLGGTTAWAVHALQRKSAVDDRLRQAAEAACTRYLVIAHQERVPAEDAPRLAARWPGEVSRHVGAQWERLAPALQAGAAHDAAVPMLRAVLLGVLLGVLGRSLTPSGD